MRGEEQGSSSSDRFLGKIESIAKTTKWLGVGKFTELSIGEQIALHLIHVFVVYVP